MSPWVKKIASHLTDCLNISRMIGRWSYHENRHHRYWEDSARHWNDIASPVRPSNGDIEIYRAYIKKENGVAAQKILILGATPELRDLAQEGRAHVHVADFSSRMLHSMLRFTKCRDPRKENWAEENWLRLLLPKNHFDLILGDLILQQVPPPLEPQLLEKIHSLLAPAGVFLGRFQYLGAEFSPSNVERIITRELEKPIPDRQKLVPLKLRVLWCSADRQTRTLDRALSAQFIDEYTKKYGTKNTLMESIKKNILRKEDAFRTWSPLEEKELTRSLSRHFNIAERKTASDYEDSRYYPIFALKK